MSKRKLILILIAIVIALISTLVKVNAAYVLTLPEAVIWN